MNTFSLGEWLLLVAQKGKKWLVRITEAPFSCHLGTIQMTDILSREEGDWLETTKGAKLYLFRPTLADFIYHMKRETQIIYPKDLGAMLFYGDVHPGAVVFECGLGSGALSLALLRAVGEKGRVISVEKRPEFARLARKNIAGFHGRSPDNHHIIVADIAQMQINVLADRVFLDLPEPWAGIGPAAGLLKRGGLLVSLSPQAAQVQLTCKELKTCGFTNISTFELLKRDWIVDDRRARPKDRMVAHTGFITVAKKAFSSLRS